MAQQEHSRMSGVKEKAQGTLEKVGGTIMCSKEMRERGRIHELEGDAVVHLAKAEKAASHGHHHKAEHEERKANEKLSQIPGSHVVYPGSTAVSGAIAEPGYGSIASSQGYDQGYPSGVSGTSTATGYDQHGRGEARHTVHHSSAGTYDAAGNLIIHDNQL